MISNECILQLFILLNGIELKNCLFMVLMIICIGYFDGIVISELVEYYCVCVGSIGIIIVECCFIDDYGLVFLGVIGIDNDEKIVGLVKIVEVIKVEGLKVILQIYYGGCMVDLQLIGGCQLVVLSVIVVLCEGVVMLWVLSGEEVEGMIVKFGDGVCCVIFVGFDGVEIYGVNIYFIQQFYLLNFNQCDDEWGGSCDNCVCFLLVVLDIIYKMVCQYVDDVFIIGYCFLLEEMEVLGICFDDIMYLLEKLVVCGVDYLYFLVGVILCLFIVDISDLMLLIEKYCVMCFDIFVQVLVMGVGGVVNVVDVEQGFDYGYDLIVVGCVCIVYLDWVLCIVVGEELELFIDSIQCEVLYILELLWCFLLVEVMICDMSMGDVKFKLGMFVEIVYDDVNELVINVSFENDYIVDIELVVSLVQIVEFIISFEEICECIFIVNILYVDVIFGVISQSEVVKKVVVKVMLKLSKVLVVEEGGNDVVLKSYDVVVVGSGGVGLVVVIQVYDEGVSVLIVEKMLIIGGNIIKVFVGMNVVEICFQCVKGIEDSKELFYQEILKGGYNKNNLQLLCCFVENVL